MLHPDHHPLVTSEVTSQAKPPATTSALPSLDFDPAERLEPSEWTARTGAKSSKDSLSSIERRRRHLGRLSLGILAIALGVQALYLGREVVWGFASLVSVIPVVVASAIWMGFVA